MREVMQPRRSHVVVRKLEIDLERLMLEHGLDARERHLPVDWRERPADRGEGRELLRDRPLLAGSGRHAAVASRIFGDGRVDVETVDRRRGVRLQNPGRARAVALHDRRDHGRGAKIGRARPAEPGLGLGVRVVVRGARIRGGASKGGRESGRRRNEPAADGPGLVRLSQTFGHRNSTRKTGAHGRPQTNGNGRRAPAARSSGLPSLSSAL